MIKVECLNRFSDQIRDARHSKEQPKEQSKEQKKKGPQGASHRDSFVGCVANEDDGIPPLWPSPMAQCIASEGKLTWSMKNIRLCHVSLCSSLGLGPTTRTTHQRNNQLHDCKRSEGMQQQQWHHQCPHPALALKNPLAQRPPDAPAPIWPLSSTLNQSSRVPLTHGSATADRRSVGCQLIGQLPLICPVYDRTDGYAGCR